MDDFGDCIDLTNCVECGKLVCFTGKYPEYEPHKETGEKYCFECASEDKEHFTIFECI